MGIISFKAKIAREGRKAMPRITIPCAIIKQMRDEGMTFPAWIKFRFKNDPPIFLRTRWVASRPSSVDFTVPTWRYSVELGSTHDVEIEDAAPYKAQNVVSAAFDWLQYVPTDEDSFPTYDTETGLLSVWYNYKERLCLARFPTSEEHWWLMGFYQAEGSKGETGNDFTIASKLPELLQPTVHALTNTWRIPLERLYLEVLHRPDESPEKALALFKPLGVRISAVRPRVDLRGDIGEHAGVLHVSCSSRLFLMMKSALHDLFKSPFPSKDAARSYAFGWLAGDGTITLSNVQGDIMLRLAGYEDEQRVALKALEHAFEWKILEGFFDDHNGATSRALSLRQAADLASTGAFIQSMSRARLIHRLARQLQTYNNRGRSFTTEADFKYACILFDATLADEARRLAAHPLAAQDFITGEKGLPYPLKF